MEFSYKNTLTSKLSTLVLLAGRATARRLLERYAK